MSEIIDVSKLISTFGFKVDKKQLAAAEKQIEDFKKKLSNVGDIVTGASQTKAVKEVKEKVKKVQAVIHDGHVKTMDKYLTLQAKSLARERKLKKQHERNVTQDSLGEVSRRIKKQRDIFKGKASHGRGGASVSFIDSLLGVGTQSDLTKQYRKDEIGSALKGAYSHEKSLEKAKKRKAQYESRLFSGKARRGVGVSSNSIDSLLNVGASSSLSAKLRREELSSAIKSAHDDEKAFARKKKDMQKEMLRMETEAYQMNKAFNAERRKVALAEAAAYKEDARRTAQLNREQIRLNRQGVGSSGGAPVAHGAGLAGLLAGGRKFTQGLMPSLAAGGAAFGSVMAVQGLFSKTVQIDAFNASMKAVLGSTKAASEEFEFFTKNAMELKVPLVEGMDAYKNYVASSVGSGMSLEKTRKTYVSMAKAARVFNLTQDQVNGVLKTFGQVASKGQLYAEELRQQLGDRLAGAVNMTAQGLGVTTAELEDMMKNGEISAEEFYDAISISLDRLSAGGLDDTLASTWQEFLNTIDMLVIKLSVLGSSKTMQSIIKNITNLTKELSNYLLPVILLIAKGIEGITWVLSTRSGAFIATVIVAAKVVRTLSAAMKTLAVTTNLAFLPYYLITGAVIAFGIAIEDIFRWLEGKSSLFGILFGDISEYGFILNVYKSMKNVIKETIDYIIRAAQALGIINSTSTSVPAPKREVFSSSSLDPTSLDFAMQMISKGMNYQQAQALVNNTTASARANGSIVNQLTIEINGNADEGVMRNAGKSILDVIGKSYMSTPER